MEEDAEDSEDEEYQPLGQRFLCAFSVAFPRLLDVPTIHNSSRSCEVRGWPFRMEKNALRAMEAGGRTSVAAAYEAMAAKEAPTSRPPVKPLTLGFQVVEASGFGHFLVQQYRLLMVVGNALLRSKAVSVPISEFLRVVLNFSFFVCYLKMIPHL